MIVEGVVLTTSNLIVLLKLYCRERRTTDIGVAHNAMLSRSKVSIDTLVLVCPMIIWCL